MSSGQRPERSSRETNSKGRPARVSEKDRRIAELEAALERCAGERASLVAIAAKQQEMEGALREGEAFARKVLASSLNGLYVYDLHQQAIVFINPQYTRLTGYTLDELNSMGEQFLTLFHFRDLPRVRAHIDAMAHGIDEEIFEIEYRFRRADGQWIWCLSRETAFARADDGAVRQYIGTFLDITERKRADEERERLLEEVSRTVSELDAIIASMVDGVMVLGAEGEILRMNPTAEQMHGYTPAERELPLAERLRLRRIETVDGRRLLLTGDSPVEGPPWQDRAGLHSAHPPAGGPTPAGRRQRIPDPG